MFSLKEALFNLVIDSNTGKLDIVRRIQQLVTDAGYGAVELNGDKPWGAYIRLDGTQADDFVSDFFPGLSAEDARLGNPKAELSPKILLVSPSQRLSWQYHDRRAERWAFLTDGAYNKSDTDDPGELIHAKPGDIVQFSQSERHRLVGVPGLYTIVAEIWQHTDSANPSNEEDIVRLADDYSR